MIEEKRLTDAYEFFEQENNEFKREMEISNLLVDIACEFIKYRDKNGLTQKDLAEKLQITQAMVSKLESGDYNPTIKMLFEMAQKLSWSFKLEFNEVSRKYNYEYEVQEELEQNSEYFANMGLAS